MKNKTFKNPKISINKVYTKSGDRGYTHLAGGKKILKSDLRVDVYGELDELNSIIGLCYEELKLCKNIKLDSLDLILLKLQHQIFNLGNMFATDKLTDAAPQITIKDIENIEGNIDKYNNDLNDLNSFVLPGGNKLNAYLHLARTVTRRVERRLVNLSTQEQFNEFKIELIFLNRLSDALFVWSRWVIKVLNDDETLWNPNFRGD